MKIQVSETIKKLCPLWIKKIERRNSFLEVSEPCEINGQKLNIKSGSCCIVGEAYHAFDKKDSNESMLQMYNNCDDCDRFSMSFYRIVSSEWYSGAGTMERLEEEFKRFENHITEKHPEMIK